MKHEENDECPNYRGVDVSETAATDSVIDELLLDGLSRDQRKPNRGRHKQDLERERV